MVSGLNPATEYFYVVRAKDANSTSTNSNEVAVTTADAVTVFEDGVWSNGVPTAALDAVILSNFTTTENLEAKSLTITSGQFTVASGTVLTVVESITNNAGANAFVVENNGIVLGPFTDTLSNIGNEVPKFSAHASAAPLPSSGSCMNEFEGNPSTLKPSR